MRPGARAGALACVLAATGGAAACELVLSEHRSGAELARRALDPARPQWQIAFTHSVLGTPVSDRYEWRADGRTHLVEEAFEGQGYGLPDAAGPGQTLTRDGAGWRLRLDRVVHPLVVLPLPAQRMRLVLDGAAPLLLGTLSARSIALHAAGCTPPPG